MFALKTRVTVGDYPCEGVVQRCDNGYVTVLMDDGMELRVREAECIEAMTAAQREQLLNATAHKKKGERKEPRHSGSTTAVRVPAKRRTLAIEVDLHIEALRKARLYTPTDIPLQAQLDRFEDVMRAHMAHKGMKITFIHGVGQQTLKAALMTALRAHYPSCTCEDAPYHLYGVGGAMVVIVG